MEKESWRLIAWALLLSSLALSFNSFVVPAYARMLDDFGTMSRAAEAVIEYGWFLAAVPLATSALLLFSALEASTRLNSRVMLRTAQVVTAMVLLVELIALASSSGNASYLLPPIH